MSATLSTGALRREGHTTDSTAPRDQGGGAAYTEIFQFLAKLRKGLLLLGFPAIKFLFGFPKELANCCFGISMTVSRGSLMKYFLGLVCVF